MKTERFEMRLDQHNLQRIDTWRAEQPNQPSRAEAMRRLVDAGLAVLGSDDVRITHGEKLILMMLRDFYKHHEVEGEIEPDFVSEVLGGGHYWGLEWEYSGLFHGHVDNENVVTEVADVLEMWSQIEFGYSKLSDKDKKEVGIKADLFGQHVMFPGFDGNDEPEHFHIALFLINHLDRFQEFKKHDLNSHCPSIGNYRRMWQIYKPMVRALIGRHLSCSEIIDLLNA